MHQRLKINLLYTATLCGIFGFVVIELFLSGGLIPALVFLLGSAYFLMKRFASTVHLTDTGITVINVFGTRIVNYEDILSIVRTEELGKGRERFIIYYTYNRRKYRFVIPAYKFWNAEQFVAQLMKRCTIDIEEPHLVRPMYSKILFIILCTEAVYTIVQLIWRTGDSVISLFKDSYIVYNYVFLWLIIGIFLIFSLLRFYQMVKKGYHYLFYYRGTFFALLFFGVILLAGAVGKNNTRNEMYGYMMQTRFELERYKLEEKKYPEVLPEFLSNTISGTVGVATGFTKLPLVFEETQNPEKKDRPGTVWLVLTQDGAIDIFASYIDNDRMIRYIDDNDKQLSWEELRGTDNNRNK